MFKLLNVGTVKYSSLYSNGPINTLNLYGMGVKGMCFISFDRHFLDILRQSVRKLGCVGGHVEV